MHNRPVPVVRWRAILGLLAVLTAIGILFGSAVPAGASSLSAAPYAVRGINGHPTLASNPSSSVYTPLTCPHATKNSHHVSVHADGSTWYNGSAITLGGYSFDPADDGYASAWHSSAFTTYIDGTLANEAYLGANLVRPTDQFDTSGAWAWDDPVFWANMDHLVCKAAGAGTFVELDLSFFKDVLEAAGYTNDYGTNSLYQSSLWLPMIDAVAAHYAGWQSIAFVSFTGEPPAPATSAQVSQLVTFYGDLAREYQVYDSAHALAPGGFSSTNNGVQSPQPWWLSICSQNTGSSGFTDPFTICMDKTYSQHDLNYAPTFISDVKALGSMAWFNAEFGADQALGDATWSGWTDTTHGLAESRKAFFTQVYALGFEAYVAWNDSCLVGSGHYDFNPSTPAVVSVIQANAAVTPTGSSWVSGTGTC